MANVCSLKQETTGSAGGLGAATRSVGRHQKASAAQGRAAVLAVVGAVEPMPGIPASPSCAGGSERVRGSGAASHRNRRTPAPKMTDSAAEGGEGAGQAVNATARGARLQRRSTARCAGHAATAAKHNSMGWLGSGTRTWLGLARQLAHPPLQQRHREDDQWLEDDKALHQVRRPQQLRLQHVGCASSESTWQGMPPLATPHCAPREPSS